MTVFTGTNGRKMAFGKYKFSKRLELREEGGRFEGLFRE